MHRDDIQGQREKETLKEKERDKQKKIFPKHVCVRERVRACVLVCVFKKRKII